MNTLLNLITDLRTCIAKLQASNINGFKKGKHLARLNGRLRKLYRFVANIYMTKKCWVWLYSDDAAGKSAHTADCVDMMMKDSNMVEFYLKDYLKQA